MKKFFFEFIFLLLYLFAPAQSHVTKSAGFGEEIPGPACLACAGTDWFNPEYIGAADGLLTFTGLNVYGTCFMSTCYYSRYLYAHHFNFSIPVDATIDSIFVDIFKGALTENSIQDSIVQLQKNGTPVGSNLASDIFWPVSFHYSDYGHNDPLWGTSWLPEDLNDTTFGVTLKIKNISDKEVDAAVDHIRMTVYYSTSTGIHSVTSSPCSIEWINTPNEISVNIITPEPASCSSKIYNLNGQVIDSFDYGRSLSGQNHFEYSIKNLADEIYVWTMMIGRNMYSRKFLVMKY